VLLQHFLKLQKRERNHVQKEVNGNSGQERGGGKLPEAGMAMSHATGEERFVWAGQSRCLDGERRKVSQGSLPRRY